MWIHVVNCMLSVGNHGAPTIESHTLRFLHALNSMNFTAFINISGACWTVKALKIHPNAKLVFGHVRSYTIVGEKRLGNGKLPRGKNMVTKNTRMVWWVTGELGQRHRLLRTNKLTTTWNKTRKQLRTAKIEEANARSENQQNKTVAT